MLGRRPGSSFRYSPRIDAALAFAAEKHATQRRKGSRVPYVVHPVQVAWLLRAYGLDEVTVVAGLLHDVLEDTDCTRDELAVAFGPEVTAIVAACTEPDKSLPWEQRKEAMLARMPVLPPPARAVMCADKAHNLHTMADAVERGEDDFWGRFSRGAPEQLRFYSGAVQALANGWRHPILEELRGALTRLEAALGTS